MVKICFNVEGQHLARTCKDYLANESMAVLKLVATFNSEWDGFTKYALFGYKGEHYCSYPTLTNDGYEFIVPSEVLLGHGFYFTLVGYTSEDDEVITRLTTNQAYIRLNESGFTKHCKNGHFEEVDDEAIESLFTVFYTKAETDTLLAEKSDKNHTHGNITNDGEITTPSEGTFTYFTGIGSGASSLYKTNRLNSNSVIDTTAHAGIGSAANESQTIINGRIDNAITNINNTITGDVLSFECSKPFLETGEGTDLIITLMDKIGQPLTNKTVTVTDGTSTYTGTTDNNGEYKLYFVNVTGDTTFTATYNNITATCRVVGDCNIIDYGTTSNHNDIWVLTNFKSYRTQEYTAIVETSTTAGSMVLDDNNKITPSQTVELDLLVKEGGNTSSVLYVRNDENTESLGYLSRQDMGVGLNEWVHLKLQFNNTDTVTVTTSKKSESFTLSLSATSNNYRLLLSGSSNITTILFKNFVIYG